MKTALVTGGGGFLGNAIITELLKEGWKIKSIGRKAQPLNQKRGIECFQGNICNLQDVLKASQDCDTIFHVAALAGIWGSKEAYESINIQGTENVINACHQNNIPHLVYTSSPSVSFAGIDQIMSNESEKYPKEWLWHYPRTKAIAEQLINKANSEKLKTISLRPHLIWGPGDPNLLPRILERASQKKLKVVGRGDNLVDMVYVDNAARAHILAEKALTKNKGLGKNYFITNDEPVALWPWINQLLEKKKIPPIKKSISASKAFYAGMLLEKIYSFFNFSKEPPMTRFVARQLSTHHTYDISNAKRDLGYKPHISMQEGLDRYLKSI